MLEAGVITGKIIDLDGDPLRSVGVAATARSGKATTRNPGQMGNAVSNDLELVTKPPQDPHATPEAQRALVNFRFADNQGVESYPSP